MKSIHRYLLLSLITALSVGTLLIAVFMYIKSAEEINELYDSNMEELANVINTQLPAIDSSRQSIGKNRNTDNILEEEEFLVQIWNADGDRIYTSHPLIDFPMQPQSGFFTTRNQQQKWRVYSVKSEQKTIQVSQPQQARHIYIWQLASGLILPLILQIPLIGMFIWFAVGKSLRPLEKVSTAIQFRSAASLEPLNTQALPVEIRPVIEELNHLLSRLGNAIAMQRNFTADAAHELRTPLAALQLQVDMLARSQSDAERSEAVHMLQRGIKRATALVGQLLTLARLGPEFSQQKEVFDLSQAVKSEIEEHLDQAAMKNIDLGFHSDAPIFIKGHVHSFRVMVRNLLDNAIRYSPDGSKVDIFAYYNDDEVILEVQDSAALIGGVERQRIFERFYRGGNSAGISGSGLGLAIVSDIVQQHHGKITIKARAEAPGNSFSVSLPRLTLQADHV